VAQSSRVLAVALPFSHRVPNQAGDGISEDNNPFHLILLRFIVVKDKAASGHNQSSPPSHLFLSPRWPPTTHGELKGLFIPYRKVAPLLLALAFSGRQAARSPPSPEISLFCGEVLFHLFNP